MRAISIYFANGSPTRITPNSPYQLIRVRWFVTGHGFSRAVKFGSAGVLAPESKRATGIINIEES